MNIERLVKMANDIGDFFVAEGDRAQTARDVASHLKRFWDPSMRKQIVAHVQQGGVGLSDHVRDAVALLAEESSGGG
jgi:formate dehydrogenase subunit delta